ncbi:MAG: TfoX/Sxy family protein [Thermoanaerobaculia bacterium]|nr:TfoX/Sxy family protein [Thermoanaerobaculia bacterium]
MSPTTRPSGRTTGRVTTSKTPRNLGPVSMKWLEAVGVHTLADIEDLGPVEVYLRVEDAGFLPGRNLLWALQGAVLDLAWADIPPDMKQQLEGEVAAARDTERDIFQPELPEIARKL